ncbi:MULTISPECIES: helix-turn-helix domain-containing protein [Rhizobium/Agrobacterium group]|uniref:XRE family transcriptional regulator n=2 Tax=Pseudorhizobium TaxID=1903858 RepID=A0ABM8PT88_9HYPH|nr:MULTISPECIES: helix-turn-helix domain-containing protein [Rhizobium/Agrobacterium group]MCF6371196.1 helix-turn-helix domain-containing protein [Rhizobium halophilum]CAD6436106.1 XRE family transcriptional regulator [Rhizobium sp. Q54]CAD7031565.1 XRE family transcriptional regulator [Pseudorhizobium endolithicum]CAD7047058.1 XRE family transcriptional regulator [Pseudorhizobium halotolerans]
MSRGTQSLIGATVRQLRNAKGMSLQQLADSSGVSVGMISQIERDLANPSMRVLTAIRRALNVSIQEMFGEQPDEAPEQGDPPFVRRLKDRPQIDLGLLKKELLTASGHHHLQIMILRVEPGGVSGNTALSYPAEKGGLVLSGELTLTVGEQTSTLRTGDSFVFDSALPHSFKNVSQSTAEILWIIGAVQFDRHL